jgi:hypothetical protein
MAPIRWPSKSTGRPILAVVKERKKLSEFDFLNQSAKDMLDQLSWWTNALKAARDKVERRAA